MHSAERSTPISSESFRKYGDVGRTNILVATAFSEIVKTMLGPKGMSKMLITTSGDTIITNNGMVVLDKMKITNPIARILIDLAITQHVMVGDGTKTVVLLAGELLKRSEELLDKKIHPTVIIKGYKEATARALEILNENAINASINDEETLKKIARTVMGGGVIYDVKGRLADIVITAVKRVAEVKSGIIALDVESISFRKKAGKGTKDSELIEGLIIYKKRPHPQMPMRVENAKIALLDCSLDPLTRKATDWWDKNYVIDSPEQLRGFIDSEKEFNEAIVKEIKRVGVNVLFCRERISEQILSCFAKEGIVALNLMDEKDMIRLGRATGGKIVSSLDDLLEKDLGWAGLVEFRKITDDEMLFVERCRDPKAVTILLRGGSEQVVEDLGRVVEDGCKAVAIAIEDQRVVAGGGAIEMEIAKKVREFSETFHGKEQLAIEAFADAVEAIPKTLAANAGSDPIDILLELRAGHDKGHTNLGFNAIEHTVEDAVECGLLDLLKVKQYAIKTASEAAIMILRIDDTIAAAKPREKREEERGREMERQRITEEKVRGVLKEEELMIIEKEVKERMMHPETI